MGLGLACMAIIVSDIIITSTVLTSTKMKGGEVHSSLFVFDHINRQGRGSLFCWFGYTAVHGIMYRIYVYYYIILGGRNEH